MRPLFVILAAVMLDSMGIGLIMPIIPELLRSLTHQIEVASDFGFFLAIYAAMQFVFSPILGALSDRFGRRPILLLSIAGASVDYIFMAFAPTLLLLYVGRIIAGVSGANMAVATAYIADITPEKDRARAYGWMNACFGLGFVAGPVLGGLAGGISLHYPFLLAAILNGLTFLIGYFVLSESHLPEKRRQKIALSEINPFASLRWVFNQKTLVPLLLFYSAMLMMSQVPASLWSIYGIDRFGWDTRMIGITFAAFGILYAAAQAFLTAPVINWLGERRALLAGLIIEVISYSLLGLATETWMTFVLTVPLAAAGIALPALQALVSKQVSENQQGQLQGTLVSLLGITSVIGPLIFTKTYALTYAFWPGTVWVGAALLYLCTIPLFWRGLKKLT
mgnify:CR=1 FL=1